ncbi:MAG: 50S ribosomal protein L18 [Methylococcaceae bacterium]|nr:50S ribosomal protein L18 [Methylococcaceae bacterium]
MDKKTSRLKRAAKTRHVIRSIGINRLTIHRTPRHIYAQIFSSDGATVLASASTLQADIKTGLSGTGNIDAAKAVGKAIAERAKEAGIENVAFDRSGFKYHGRVRALADAAREAGLNF